jgi:flagellin-specific chaperone FliS
VVLERRLIDAATHSVIYGVVMAKDSKEALRLQKEMEKLPSVSHVQSAAQFMEDDRVSEKLERIGRIKEIAEPLQILPPELNKVDVARLDQQLVRLQGYVSFAIGEV